MNEMDDATRPDGLRLGPQRLLPARTRSVAWDVPVEWNIPDLSPEDPGDLTRPATALVSVHYLRAAIRRRWRLSLLPAALGVLLGSLFLVITPPQPAATTTLMLSHDERVDAARAIATDTSLLHTRTVAQLAISKLGLSATPDEVMGSVSVIPSTSSDILQLSMTAPTRAEAVRRVTGFAQAYLDFRATQISAKSDIVIKNYNDRIVALQAKARTLSTTIQTLAASGDTVTDRLSDAVTERSQYNSQISRLQQDVQDATLQQQAIVASSRIIDPAAPSSQSGTVRIALALASGLIGGSALGFALIVVQAILSDRLRLRFEVASALNTRVTLSVRRLAPLSRVGRLVRFLPWVRARDVRRFTDRRRMTEAIRRAVPKPGRRQSLGVVCLDNSDEMAFGLVAAAAAAALPEGRRATIVDLTEHGAVATAVARLRPAADCEPEVVRPSVVPSASNGPSDLGAAYWEDLRKATGRDDMVLVLSDLNPAIGVDHLTAWTDTVLVAVSAGRSSAELVRTAGDLIRSVGLDLHGAVLLAAERDDMSSGLDPSTTASPEVAASVPSTGAATWPWRAP